MGTNYYAVKSKPTVRNPIHIGKSSMGWRFNFHRVDKWDNYINGEPLNTYPQWERFLTEQTQNGNIVLNKASVSKTKAFDVLDVAVSTGKTISFDAVLNGDTVQYISNIEVI